MKILNFDRLSNGAYIAENKKEDWHVKIEPTHMNTWRVEVNHGSGCAQLTKRKLADAMNIATLLVNNPARKEFVHG